MQTRYLGPEKLAVSAVGLGCMGMSAYYGPIDRDEARATMKRALELGIRFFDTADIYGFGHNESFVGDMLHAVRNDVVIATKFAVVFTPEGEVTGVSGRPDYLKKACDASLGRLGTDYIDLYYQHRVDPEVPIEDTVGAMSELVEAGKVRCLGLSEVSSKNLRRAHAVHPITAVQSEYSLWTRDPETGILPTCRELGVGFVPYSPLGRGVLTGKYRSLTDFDKDDWRLTNPRFQPENFEQNLALADKVAALAKDKGCTSGQLAIAWVLAQGEDIAPIPGTRRVKYLEENIEAVDVEFSEKELAAIGEALPQGSAIGERYPEGGMQIIDAEE